jgi:hypothetical protein
MNPEKHPLQFKSPDLQTSQEVQESVERQQRLNDRALQNARELQEETGESIDPELFDIKIPNNPTERINTYMDRMEKIFLNPDERVKNRNLKLLRPYIYDEFIIKSEEVPESYFQLQQQVAREQGIDVQDIPDTMRKEMIDTIIKDQAQSLDNWIDYLASEDATYPTWFKYFVFQNITKLSQFDKSLGKFKDRTDTTVAPYPDVYREPLAQICDMYEQVADDNKVLKTDPEIQRQFSKSFPRLYAELITKSLQSSIENREEIKGEWIKYSQGNTQDADKLYKSLEGKGTGWCTAGKSTSDAQIKSGDFYVYYTYTVNNEPTQPRIAIRMNGTNAIGEVRGILQHQSLESQFNDILEDKLSEFGPEADKYKKKSEDMKQMTEIEKKTNAGEQLSKSELEFLYELNSTIEGFGYQKDPRIEEIRSKRNKTEDALILFECTQEQIANSKEQVNENTKAYIGPLYPNIFKELLDTIEHVYTTFPEGRVYIKEIHISAEEKTPEQYEQDIEAQGMKVGDWAKDILSKANLKEGLGKNIKVIIPTVASLGFSNGATRQEIQDKAKELGIARELLPAITGIELRKQYTDQPLNEYILIDMENILGRRGNPGVFDVDRNSDGTWLDALDGGSGRRWVADDRWAFLAS